MGLKSSVYMDQYRTGNLRSIASIDQTFIPTLTIGLMGELKLGDSFLLGTGLSMSRSHRKFTYTESSDGPIGPVFSEYVAYVVERDRRMDFLSVPFSVGWQFDRWVFQLGLRMSYLYKINEDKSVVKYISLDGSSTIIEKDDDYQRIEYEEFIRIDYRLNENWRLSLGTIFSLNSQYYDSLMPRFRYSFGVVRFFDRDH